MKPRFRNLLKNLCLSAASLLIFVALLEGALRLCGYGNVEVYSPDPLLYWRLKPNQNCFTKINHQPVRVNSQGTRGPEFAAAKPTDTVRILSLGDSRTFGWGLSEKECYSEVLGRLLQEKAGRLPKIEVINAGVNGWSYSQMHVYFREVALRYHPDLVILGEANLYTQFTEHNSPEFVRKFMTRVRLKNLLRRCALYHFVVEVQLKEFYERYRTRFIPVDPQRDALFKAEQQEDPYGVFREAMESLCQVARTNGVKPVLLYLPMLTDLQSTNPAPLFRIKSEVSRRLKVPLVDLSSELRTNGKALYLEGDPVHLNAEGNELIARKLFQTVSEQLFDNPSAIRH
ncbi:MAG: SGNH/GDSL hydrolase family protein [Verrucomicrobia bacterium]|nr:SGNH/GDSL hydrolase family protein [Verrucomicrobiota bacterium]